MIFFTYSKKQLERVPTGPPQKAGTGTD